MKTPAPQPFADAINKEFSHPLRIFPWFRKLPDTLWTAVMLTGVFSLLSGIIIALIGAWVSGSPLFPRLGISLVYAFSIGYSIHGLSRLFVPTIRSKLRDLPFIVRLIADLALWIGGALIGVVIAAYLMDQKTDRADSTVVYVIFGTLIISGITGVLLRQMAMQEVKAEREKTERSETQRTLAVARLRLLQAQIEPHFLFNTLANVSSLIESDPKQARQMLDQFTLLLRASLDQTRKETTTLGAELQVVQAYLSVLKVRMGDRLNYKVSAPPELLKIEVPAMLLQPIVENAVKHGIEPRVKGGTVTVDVSRENVQLALSVADDGVGFVPGRPENVGLGAVRERLAVQFGANASLTTERTPDNWTRVSIRIPMSA